MPVRDWGYLSSEARSSIPLSDEGAGGVLTVGTNVYEFVEASQVDEEPDDPGKWEFLDAHFVPEKSFGRLVVMRRTSP